ncbi:MAG: metallophosphoesterase [Halobacteriaceae archaeon]
MAPELRYGERVVYLPGPDVLALADLHVGRDATANVEFPLGEREDLLDRLGSALERFEPGTVVVAGDYLHAFGDVPDGVPDTVAAIEAAVADAGASLVVTPGNHDTALASLSDAPLHDAFRAGTAVFAHGHESPPPGADLYVVGHEHPVIEIEGRRRPCFLHAEGAHEGGDVLVVPPFTRLAAGVPVNGLERGDARSPLLADPGRFRPLVFAGDEVLEFPRLDSLRSML